MITMLNITVSINLTSNVLGIIQVKNAEIFELNEQTLIIVFSD